MCDHEAGIEAAIIDQKSGQAAHLGIDQNGQPPFGDRGDFAQYIGEGIAGQSHRFGVEIATGKGFITIGKNQRIVGDRIGFGFQNTGAKFQHIKQAPMTCGWQRREYGS